MLRSWRSREQGAAASAPPAPIRPGTYRYHHETCKYVSSVVFPGGGGCWYDAVKVTVDPASGSGQRSHSNFRGDDGCDYVSEQTVDYQPDGIHLLQTMRDDRHSLVAPECGMGVVRFGTIEVCNPVPSPLILPTGAKPGYHLSFTMACPSDWGANIRQVSIDIVGTKKVMIDGRGTTTLVALTHDKMTNAFYSYERTYRSWVTPRNGLIVWEKGTYYAPNVFTYAIRMRWTTALSICATCSSSD
jgi:hypothetical protein